MKWFKHESDDRNKIVSKLIRSKFGAEGYGIFQALKEIVAEYVEQENLSEWGMVHPLHTIETLAEECSTTPEKLRDFLTFCNEKGIIEKRQDRLFYQDMLRRLDDFAARIKRGQKPSTKLVRTKYDIKENKREENKIKQNKEEKIEKNISYLSKIPENDLKEFVQKFVCSENQVRQKGEALLDWCKSNGKLKKDYKAFLRNALRKDFGNRPITQKTNPEELAPALSEEDRARARKKIEEIKKKGVIKSF
jgi:hypothetical protein